MFMLNKQTLLKGFWLEIKHVFTKLNGFRSEKKRPASSEDSRRWNKITFFKVAFE